MSKDDDQLQMELEALPWSDSKFRAKSMWVPKSMISDSVVAGVRQRQGRFYGEAYVYYLSRFGNMTKYSDLWDPLEEWADRGKGVQMGTKMETPVCPECGEPLDREHRGLHSHT